MGWGIDFKTNIFLNKITITSKGDLLDLIKEKETDVLKLKSLIRMYVSGSPKEIAPKHWEDDVIGLGSYK